MRSSTNSRTETPTTSSPKAVGADRLDPVKRVGKGRFNTIEHDGKQVEQLEFLIFPKREHMATTMRKSGTNGVVVNTLGRDPNTTMVPLPKAMTPQQTPNDASVAARAVITATAGDVAAEAAVATVTATSTGVVTATDDADLDAPYAPVRKGRSSRSSPLAV